MTDRSPRDASGKRLPLEARHFDDADRFEEASLMAARIYERTVAVLIASVDETRLDWVEEKAWDAALTFLSGRQKREEKLDREMFEASEKQDRDEKLAGRPT